MGRPGPGSSLGPGSAGFEHRASLGVAGSPLPRLRAPQWAAPQHVCLQYLASCSPRPPATRSCPSGLHAHPQGNRDVILKDNHPFSPSPRPTGPDRLHGLGHVSLLLRFTLGWFLPDWLDVSDAFHWEIGLKPSCRVAVMSHTCEKTEYHCVKARLKWAPCIFQKERTSWRTSRECGTWGASQTQLHHQRRNIRAGTFRTDKNKPRNGNTEAEGQKDEDDCLVATLQAPEAFGGELITDKSEHGHLQRPLEEGRDHRPSFNFLPAECHRAPTAQAGCGTHVGPVVRITGTIGGPQ